MATFGQLNPELIEQYALGDVEPDAPMSARLAWRLGQGQTVGDADRAEVGASMATLSATVGALRKAGWQIRTTSRPRGTTGGASFTVEQRPSVPAVRVVDDASAPPNGASKRAAERIELQQYRAMHAPAPDAPPVGTVLRATMVAEGDGAAVMALRDRAGTTWFVRVEGAGSI